MQVTLTDPQADVGTLQAAVAEAGKYTLLAPTAATMPASTSWDDAPTEGWFTTYRPLLLIVGYILAASVLVQIGIGAMNSMQGAGAAITLNETMRYFMAGFFLVFSFFKLLDVRAFADAYAGYDLLAARWHGWGRVYPYVELALGVAYLTHFSPVFTHWVTVVVMGFSAIGVIQAVASKRSIQCACLGAVFKLPMSTVTIVEDVGMVLMALWMLAVAA